MPPTTSQAEVLQPGAASGSSKAIEDAVVALISKDAVRVPPYPAVAFRISALLGDDDFHLEDLLKLVASDPSLSADVLRAANSAIFGFGDPVSSIHYAVLRIGAREVSAVALASGLGGPVRQATPLASLKRQAWQDSIASALLCQKLGAARGRPGEDAFACGLLHDFGRIVTAACLEQILESSPPPLPQPASFWEPLIDRFHLEVGLVTATRWSLSRLLRDAITLHHGDSLDACEDPEILDAVMAADEIIRLARTSPGLSADDLESLRHLRSRAERELIEKTLPLCPEFIAAFDVGGAPGAEKPVVEAQAAPDTFKPVDHPVSMLGKQPAQYRAKAMGPNVLVLEGATPMAVNRLTHLRLEVKPKALEIWANVCGCERTAAGHRLELRPFALSEEALKAWGAALQG